MLKAIIPRSQAPQFTCPHLYYCAINPAVICCANIHFLCNFFICIAFINTICISSAFLYIRGAGVRVTYSPFLFGRLADGDLTFHILRKSTRIILFDLRFINSFSPSNPMNTSIMISLFAEPYPHLCLIYNISDVSFKKEFA